MMFRRIQLFALGQVFQLSPLSAHAAVTPIYVATNGAASGNEATLGAPVRLVRAKCPSDFTVQVRCAETH
jgi:hypothetical protein